MNCCDSSVEQLGGRERKQLKEEMSIKAQDASIHTQKGCGSAL